MKDSSVVVFSIIALLLAYFVLFTPLNNSSNVITGFTSSPLYSGYAIPINGIVVDNNLNFANSSDMVQKSLDVSDDIIYRRAYVSYDGQAWTQFNLTPTGTATGEWIYGRGISTMLFSPSILHVNTSRNFTNNTYIIIYTCSKNITIHNWSCHDGWQIIPFNAKLNSGSSSSTFTWTNELMINGGFESGNLNYWTISGSGWTVGNHLNNAQYAVPQNGNYCAFVNGSSDSNFYIYQDVDLSSYSSYIDSGKAFVNASGWGVSSESPGQDLSRIQILFLNSAKGIIATASDSGVVDNPSWWQKGISNYIIPSGTRYIRMWGNTYEQGYSSGNLDSFSVKVGYGGTPITPPTCTAETNAAFCLRLGKNCGTVTGIDNCSNPRTVTSCGQCTSPATCSGGGTANICGITTCTPTTCSAQGKNCGTIADGCGNTLTCGSYSGGCQSGYTCNNGICTISTSTGTTYYISTNGNDGNSGTQSSPWKTLYKACSTVTKSGSTIHVNAGTYTETQQFQLAAGVSIEGVGVTSIIHSYYSSGNLIDLYSTPNAGTNGNQSISYLQIEGGTTITDLVGYSAIKVTARSNVDIHHCTIQNFAVEGVIFYGGGEPPSLYPVGDKFHDNILTNCARMTPGDGNSGEGALCIGGTQGMLVYNNTIRNNQRPKFSDGYGIKYYGNWGLNKGLKIYNNTITQPTLINAQSGFNFAMELWYSAGGLEIYNNTVHGTIDVPNCKKDWSSMGVTYPEGTYTYGTKIYNNFIGWDTPQSVGDDYTNDDGEFGIRVEMATNNIYIFNNHIKNVGVGITLNSYDQTSSTIISQDHVYIYYNLFENIGPSESVSSKGWGIQVADGVYNNYQYWYIENNVFASKTSGGTTMYAIGVPGGYANDVVSNIFIRNNIIQNFNYAAINSNGGTASTVSIENNIFYNNGNSNAVRGTTSGWTSYTNQNNYPGINPLFTSSTDFHLNLGSPAIDKGINVGLNSDYEGAPVPQGAFPDIGAYEYH